MLQTMYAAPGRGLAAPQVGETCRMFVMDVAWKTGAPDPVICVNPVIIEASDVLQTRDEGCLSIPDVPMPITRPATITLSWQDLTGAAHIAQLSGDAATCAQHELDHLDGVVIFDRVARDLRASLEAGYLA
jgi:peptide deformylase